jgi:RNA polymerase sigma-70 factor (ECF subfamily)
MTADERRDLEAAIGQRLDERDLNAAANLAIRGYGPEILGYMAAILRDDDAAAESFSRFAEDLWKGVAGFQRKASFRTWAYRVAWNAAQDTAADSFRRRARRLATDEQLQLVQSVHGSSMEFLASAAKTRLEALRANLDPAEQTLLILRINRGLSWNDVAHVLATPEQPLDAVAVRKRFARVKDKLRKMARSDGRQTG